VSTTAPPELALPPPMPDSAGDAVPRLEPRARNGNPPFYDVLGHRYYVLSSSVGYWERGVASWYGPGFHKVRTSSGEVADMYAMTAAHKTLPCPPMCVTNLQNGRSIVVRVNDAVPSSAIDHRLSYSAASRLGMLHNGTAMVEVRSVDPAAAADAAGTASNAAAPASGCSCKPARRSRERPAFGG
jgi:rare lipoprotein A